MDLTRLQGGADHAVQPRAGGVFGVVHHHLLQGPVNEKLPFHPLLADGGELGDSDEQGAGTAGPGEALQGRLHHGRAPGGMEVHHIHVQPGQTGHRAFHGIGDIVELQIQKNFVAPGFDRPNNRGTLGEVELHADFHKGLLR